MFVKKYCCFYVLFSIYYIDLLKEIVLLPIVISYSLCARYSNGIHRYATLVKLMSMSTAGDEA